MDYLKRITIDPEIMTGKPVIEGTRIPVELILKKLAQNINIGEILRDYPTLEKEDVRAAILYAQNVLEQEKVYPVKGART